MNIYQIIYNKIYNENIFFYEDMALSGNDYKEFVLEEGKINEDDIKNAILQNQDLNSINGINLKNYIQTDLNIFYKQLIDIREKGLDFYIDFFKKEDIESIVDMIPNIIDYFTIDESFR